ncbi:unnamed protein product, partial [Iphiclides podalirius]
MVYRSAVGTIDQSSYSRRQLDAASVVPALSSPLSQNDTLSSQHELLLSAEFVVALNSALPRNARLLAGVESLWLRDMRYQLFVPPVRGWRGRICQLPVAISHRGGHLASRECQPGAGQLRGGARAGLAGTAHHAIP